MTEEQVFLEAGARAPTGYKLKQLIPFSYPFREITIKSEVNKNPDASMTNIYRQILLTIDAGFCQRNTLFQFLGISLTDEFMTKELDFLFEKELLEYGTEGYAITPSGRQFINDSTVLKINDVEDYRFLIDGITLEIISTKEVFTYRERQENFLASRNVYPRKNKLMMENKMEEIAECYKQDAAHGAYLITQEIPEIQKDWDVWGSYLLAIYIHDALTAGEDLKLEVLLPKSLNKAEKLTELFNEDVSLFRGIDLI